MPKQKMLRSKEAISPILATLLLIVIAVAAIVVTYAWIMTYMSSAGQSAGISLYKENVNWDSATNTTRITVGNSGTANAKIVRLYVGASANNLVEVTANTNIGSGITLNAKSAVTITLSWPNSFASSWTPGNYYYFKVVCETGQELPFQAQAEQ